MSGIIAPSSLVERIFAKRERERERERERSRTGKRKRNRIALSPDEQKSVPELNETD